ncbi:beta-amyrin 6-beta-monooxygenase-like [Salvia hispanica]|uniref:beta-amyrin 6-beta-monooxygenase-like n=1 Tax=Salvia hispanica TaxID=49212 RepID=UPI002009DBAD|nr:beta-amyrin 6-beta-monooxygenase-like [Salvia hispanica]
MEIWAILAYFLPLFLLLFSIIWRNASDDRKKLPPGSQGWPVLGENLRFSPSPEKFVAERMSKHSPEIFQTSLLGEKMATFCGAKGNKFLFSNENKLVTSWLPQSLMKVLTFAETAKSNADGHSAFTRILHRDIFSPETLKKYVPEMDALAREHMARDWKPNSVVTVLPASKKYTFELACRIFLCEADPERVRKLSEPFAVAMKGLFSVPVDLPGTAYRRAIRAGEALREELMRMVGKRKKARDEGEARDILSKMLMERNGDGEFLSEKEICNRVVGMLVASYDTTSYAVTSVMDHLAQFPHIYNEVFKEQMAIAETKGPSELLTWDDIEKMKYSWNVVRESLRVTPPAAGAFREAATEFTYAGFTIPKGWKTFWTVYSTHKNPEYFPEPERFDPSRFEGSGPAPFTFVPFGGGPKMCAGKEYARLELLVMIHNVVTRFKLEKTIPDEKIVYYATPTPVHGLPLRLHPHQQ